jgi:hypothetical protein
MFIFSLAGDAREWYHSLPPASISSLREFHAAFNRHCQRFYSSEFICHNCCKEYEDIDQDMAISIEDCEDDGDALGELIGMAKSLSAEIERLKFKESAEDFPVLEANVLDNPTNDDSIEDYKAVEVSFFAPDESDVPVFKEETIVEEDSSLFLKDISHDVFASEIEMKNQEIAPVLQDGGVVCSSNFVVYSDEEQQIPTSYFDDLKSNQPVYESYESNFELDVQDLQEHTVEPYPLFIKEKHFEEINHPGPTENTEQHNEEHNFSLGPVYDDYESDPWESREEGEGEPKGQFISYLEPASEKPLPEII